MTEVDRLKEGLRRRVVVYDLCVENNWFLDGGQLEYNTMLGYAEMGNIDVTVHLIAKHSREVGKEEVTNKLMELRSKGKF